MNTPLDGFPSTVTETEELVRLSFFSDIAKAIASCRTVNETLNEIMRQIGQVFTPRNWSLMLRNSSSGDLKFRIVEGQASKTLLGKTIPKGTGIAGWIAENKMPLIIEDVKNDPRFEVSFDDESGFKTESIIGAPLISHGKVYGVIELINKLEGTQFTSLDLKLLTTITDFAAIAIEKAYYASGIKKLVNIDPLTEVYNRRYFQFYLTKELERIKRTDKNLSLLFIDLDDFKKINDNFGHVTGDRVLKQTAKILKRAARSSDLIFRYGGDEFIVLLPDTASESAERLKNRILESHNQEKNSECPDFKFSIGIHEAGDENFEDLLQNVDKEMYMQKFMKKENETEDITSAVDSDFKLD